MKSLAFDVEMVTLAGEFEPVAEFRTEAFGSNGDAVFAPDIPNAFTAQFWSEPVNVVVIVIEPLPVHIAYQSSKSLLLSNVIAFLNVQVKEGLDDTLDTVEPWGMTVR